MTGFPRQNLWVPQSPEDPDAQFLHYRRGVRDHRGLNARLAHRYIILDYSPKIF